MSTQQSEPADAVTPHPHHHHGHDHDHGGGHGHSHGLVDRSIVRSREGVRAVSLSFAVLFVGALIQLLVLAGAAASPY